MADININGKNICCETGDNLMKVLVDNNIFIDAPCGGNGKCGKCKVIVKGDTSMPDAQESKLLSLSEINDGVRLACETKVMGNVDVQLLNSSKMQVETEVKKYQAKLNPVIGFDYLERKIGLAVDIGTTTVVAFFYDLITGVLIDTKSSVNKQRMYGADVMKRIDFAKDENGKNQLHKVIIDLINEMIADFTEKNKVAVDCICDMVVAGNTVMQHLFANKSVASIGYAPYDYECSFGECYNARELGLNMNGKAMVYIMPVISAFLGGDCVSVMMSLEFDKRKDSCYMVDIGTNGEMAVVAHGKIYAASTAAGPAFEGAHIQFGSASVDGAINTVVLENGKITYKTIGNCQAASICGSGLIDAVAVMLDCQAIDETGAIDSDNSYVTDDNFNITDNIYITQRDIREIQLAKSAIAAGCEVLVNNLGLEFSDIDNVFIAGGFGSAINLTNTGKISLLPNEFIKKAKVVGNAAGAGAVYALLDTDNRIRCEHIAKSVTVCELTQNKQFEDSFVENMFF